MPSYNEDLPLSPARAGRRRPSGPERPRVASASARDLASRKAATTRSPRSVRSSASAPSNVPGRIVHADQVADAADGHGDRAAADGALDGRLGQPCLGALQLLLHLLGLLEQGVHVEAAALEGVEGVVGHRVTSRGLVVRGSQAGHWCGISSITCGAERRAGGARRRPGRRSSASGSSGSASASASARSSGRPARRRPVGSLDGLAARRDGTWLRGGGVGGRVRGRPASAAAGPRGSPGGSDAAGAGTPVAAAAPARRRWAPGVDDRLDRPVDADHVDRGLAHDLGAAALGERLAGAGVAEAERQRRRRPPPPPGRAGSGGSR